MALVCNTRNWGNNSKIVATFTDGTPYALKDARTV
jgi:hypothetical protein